MQEVKISFHCDTITATKMLRYYEQVTGTSQLEPPYELKDEPKVEEAPKEEPKVEEEPKGNPLKEVDLADVRKVFAERAMQGLKEDNLKILAEFGIAKLSEATPEQLVEIYERVG